MTGTREPLRGAAGWGIAVAIAACGAACGPSREAARIETPAQADPARKCEAGSMSTTESGAAVDLSPGTPVSVWVDAGEELSGCSTDGQRLRLVAGRRYRFVVSGVEDWRDWFVPATPADGWLGCYGWVEPLLRPKARDPNAPLYSLVGAIGSDGENLFAIGGGTVVEAPATGPFGCFANDWPEQYCNNHGTLTLTVEAIE